MADENQNQNRIIGTYLGPAGETGEGWIRINDPGVGRQENILELSKKSIEAQFDRLRETLIGQTLNPSVFTSECLIEPDTLDLSISLNSKTKKVIKKKALKAKKFLKSWLTASEYKELQKDGLTIPSKIFLNRTYKVKKWATKMVEVYDNGRLDHKLCAIDQTGKYENDDTVLAKILMLKANERKFLKIAKRYPIRPSELEWDGNGRFFPDGFGITWVLGSREPVQIYPHPDNRDIQPVSREERLHPSILQYMLNEGAESEIEPFS